MNYPVELPDNEGVSDGNAAAAAPVTHVTHVNLPSSCPSPPLELDTSSDAADN